MNIISNNPAPSTLTSSLSRGGVNSAMERMSSGLRVNTAKDDAAGMAISGRFTSQAASGKTITDSTDGVPDVVQISNEALAGASEALEAMRNKAASSAQDGAGNSRQSVNEAVKAMVAAAMDAANKTQFADSAKLSGSTGAGVVDQHTSIENATNRVDATVTPMSGAVDKGNGDAAVATVDGQIVDAQAASANRTDGPDPLNQGAFRRSMEAVAAESRAMEEQRSASGGRVMGAAFAEETAALESSKIVQRAGITTVGQSGAVPETLLGLFR